MFTPVNSLLIKDLRLFNRFFVVILYCSASFHNKIKSEFSILSGLKSSPFEKVKIKPLPTRQPDTGIFNGGTAIFNGGLVLRFSFLRKLFFYFTKSSKWIRN